ncbi:MAG: OmpH family outer membrane protein [Verrucomicrobia bacterium]|nr:OmpH family outer membrane protein [Verrucomicrobiota bacterium]MBS0637176.1 OmpH family outer membrane protein [Verrucomicrobiota bacterium]
MDSADLSMASWNYFHPTVYPNAAEKNGFKKVSLGALKVVSYLTVIAPLIMLAVHHRSTKLAFGDKVVYKLPIFKQDPKILELVKNRIPDAQTSKDKPGVTNPNPLPVPPTFVRTTAPSCKTDDEQDVLEFVNAILGDKELHKTVEKVVANVHDINKSIHLIVDSYVEYRKQNQLSELDDAQKGFLLKFMGHQIQAFKQPSIDPPKATIIDTVPSRTKNLDNGYELKIYSTNGNGSCGIHALVGKPKGTQYQADGAKVRADFCAELRRQHKEHALPARIEQTLKDYLESPENAPDDFSHNEDVQAACEKIDAFRGELSNLRKERQKFLTDLVKEQKSAIQARIDALLQQGKSEQDRDVQALVQELQNYQLKPPADERIAAVERAKEELISSIIYDEKILEAYLGCLQQVGQYLLQDELIAIADSLGKRVVLFQPGWGDEHGKLQYSEVTASGIRPIDLKDIDAKKMVCIYYNGYNHYERAEVSPTPSPAQTER